MKVIDLLEQYVCSFLQACATLLILLNTQRISQTKLDRTFGKHNEDHYRNLESTLSTKRVIYSKFSTSTLFDEVVQDEEEAESSTQSIWIEESLLAVTPSPDATEVCEISDISSSHIVDPEEDIWISIIEEKLSFHSTQAFSNDSSILNSV